MSDRKSYLANIERKRVKRAARRREHHDKYADRKACKEAGDE